MEEVSTTDGEDEDITADDEGTFNCCDAHPDAGGRPGPPFSEGSSPF